MFVIVRGWQHRTAVHVACPLDRTLNSCITLLLLVTLPLLFPRLRISRRTAELLE